MTTGTKTAPCARIDENDGQRRLCATRNISQGETVCLLEGPPLKAPDRFSIEVGPETHIDCRQTLAGAINHSCKPNCAVRGFKIIAWECVSAGEELTIDYRRTETKLANPFRCICCGKVIE